MCTRITCNKCGKPSYAGCGRHVEAVLGDVPKDQRCQCAEQQKQQTPAPGWLRKLFS